MESFILSNLAHLDKGDAVLLAIIGLLVFAFFKIRAPHIQRKFETKMGKEECEEIRNACKGEREICHDLVLQKIEAMHDVIKISIESSERRQQDIKDDLTALSLRIDRVMNGKAHP